MSASTVLVTGAAGFIGAALAYKLTKQHTVIGIDNLASNYDTNYKLQKLKNLKKNKNFIFQELDILNNKKLESLIKKYKPVTILHLAALTGVRASVEKPKLYREVNAKGVELIYKAAVKNHVKNFIFSSSSSVYGNSTSIPFRETQKLSPQSPYAKSKHEAEKILKKLSKKHKMPTTVLRFFSVYGPGGRPDMAPYLFTKAAFLDKEITQFGDGSSARDYTYIDDIVSAIELVIPKRFQWETINLGNSQPVSLRDLISTVEKYAGKKIKIKKVGFNPAESSITYADISKAQKLLKWKPRVSINEGIKQFVDWYKKTQL